MYPSGLSTMGLNSSKILGSFVCASSINYSNHPKTLKGIFPMRTVKKIILPLVIVCVIIVSVTLLRAKSNTSELEQKYIVKLYAGDKVVATYQAIGACRVDGYTLVFNLNPTLEQKMVRICGTYSVEQIQ
jgi:hypothetical protein